MKKIIINLFLLFFITGCSSGSIFVRTDDGMEVSDNPTGINYREAINNYLLSQKDFVWQTEDSGKNFCAFHPLNKINKSEIYIWLRCSEFALKNKNLQEFSGSSLPVKLIYLGDNNFSHQIPRDGALYSDDLNTIFPEYVRKEIIENKNTILVNTNSDLIEQAKQYFEIEDFSSIPQSFIQRCVEDSDCITPFNYLIRSSCPYTSKCVTGSCQVVCEL